MSSLNRFHYESPDGKRFYFDSMIQEHGNIGMPPVKYIEDSGAQQSGVNIRDWRINPRKINLKLFMSGRSKYQTRGEMLADLIDVIRPNRGANNTEAGWLRFYNDNYKMMEIPATVLSDPSGQFNYGGEIGKNQVDDNILFYCPDPIWREVEKNTIVVDQSNWGNSCLGEAGVTLSPTPNPTSNFTYPTGAVSSSSFSVRMNCISGSIENPQIRNTFNTLQGMHLEGFTLNAGESITYTVDGDTWSAVTNTGTDLTPYWKRYASPGVENIPVFTLEPGTTYRWAGVGTGIFSFSLTNAVYQVYYMVDNVNTCLTNDNINPFCLSMNYTLMQNIPIQYNGTWNGDQLDIKITGSVSQPVIQNLTTNKTIQLNYNIPSGEYVIITIRPEYATVEDSNGNDLIGTVESISDLVDFQLVTRGKVSPSGENIIIISGTGADIDTSAIQVDYYTRHISAYGNPEID